MPSAISGDYKTVGDVIMEYRVNMGSIKNCSFCYENLLPLFLQLKNLKDEGHVDILSVSSVGPGIFALTDKEKFVTEYFSKHGLLSHIYEINNGTYEVVESHKIGDFWETPTTISRFADKKPCTHVTKCLDKFSGKTIAVGDIGFGGGRHSKLAKHYGFEVYGIDLSWGMVDNMKKNFSRTDILHFTQGTITDIPFNDNMFDVLICTGVIHQTKNRQEYIRSIKELHRILKKGGTLVMNVFTNNFIDNDLLEINEGYYENSFGTGMMLISAEENLLLFAHQGFTLIRDTLCTEITNIGYATRSIMRAEFSA